MFFLQLLDLCILRFFKVQTVFRRAFSYSYYLNKNFSTFEDFRNMKRNQSCTMKTDYYTVQSSFLSLSKISTTLIVTQDVYRLQIKTRFQKLGVNYFYYLKKKCLTLEDFMQSVEKHQSPCGLDVINIVSTLKINTLMILSLC